MDKIRKVPIRKYQGQILPAWPIGYEIVRFSRQSCVKRRIKAKPTYLLFQPPWGIAFWDTRPDLYFPFDPMLMTRELRTTLRAYTRSRRVWTCKVLQHFIQQTGPLWGCYKTLKAGKIEVGPLIQTAFIPGRGNHTLFLLQMLWLGDSRMFKRK